MVDPRLVLIAAVFAACFYVGEAAVAGIKKVDRAVAHGAKVAGQKIVHVFHHPTKEEPAAP